MLGGPGSGKTTLMKYLARTFALDEATSKLGLVERRLPILLPLREWAREQRTLTADHLAQYVVHPDILATCPEGFFQEQLQAGRCLVLLDGMDEVTTEAERNDVAGQINKLVSAYPGNRFVVTSRPAGHEGVSLAGFALLHVRDFSDEDVAEFARRWYEAVEMAARDVRDDDVAAAIARQEAEEQAGRLVQE
ncbi:MAG: NACHT domain-containing protein, partial [Rhodothermaceae bacterium]|nr:NACHT domain-containing protein [Rhodothermaceae bacterium]